MIVLTKKISLILVLIVLGKHKNFSQNQKSKNLNAQTDTGNKGKVYFYWGWNTASYSNSNIHLSGENYDFTIHNASASDRITTPIGARKYLRFDNITIPQTNARIGYYFHDNWNASIGLDHMKYLVDQFQTARVSGEIDLQPEDDGTTIFNGVYNNQDTVLFEEFFFFEHTDGLNYVNLEIARVDNLGKYLKINPSTFQLNVTEGFGAGVLIPKTHAKILDKSRHDEFHVAGYGVSLKGGINLTFFNSFFLQAEIKGGFINLPDVRTTSDERDKAKHNFFFLQRNILIGGTIKLF